MEWDTISANDGKTRPEYEFSLLTGKKKRNSVTPASPWSISFLSYWRNTDVKQVCQKSQAFWFTVFSFWRLPYTTETHSQFLAYLHHFSIKAIYLIQKKETFLTDNIGSDIITWLSMIQKLKKYVQNFLSIFFLIPTIQFLCYNLFFFSLRPFYCGKIQNWTLSS